MSKILITTDYLRPGDEVDQLLRDNGHETIHRPHRTARSREQLDEIFSGVEGALIASEPVDATTIANASALRVVARSGVGYDSVDVEAATRRGVLVCNAPGSNSVAVAEMTFAALLLCCRRLLASVDGVRAGGWPRHDGDELRGAVLGIVGFGPAGRQVATLARAFGMTTLVHTRWRDAGLDGVEYAGLDELLARSDYVSLHCKLDPSTRGLIDRDRLAAMKPTAYLVNTARGGLVDEAALAEAVRTGVIAGAVLDVLVDEPLGQDHPFRTVPGITVLSHLAGQTVQARRAASMSAAESILQALGGLIPKTCVNAPSAR